MKCKYCRRECHYCSSCDTDSIYDLGFCSEECLLKSEFFKKKKEEYLKLKYPKEVLEFCMNNERILLELILKESTNEKIGNQRGI